MIFAPQAKILKHYDRIQKWLEFSHTDPILFEIAPTGYCNASCPWCFFVNRKTNEIIDKQIMLEALFSMKLLKVKAINWTGGGEPTLHPFFATFVLTASKLGLKQGLFTNAYRTILIKISLVGYEYL